MFKALAMAMLLTISGSTLANTCLVSPTQKDLVTGRFGKFREGGAANFGSGNSKPHMHDGLDFSTGAQPVRVLATSEGTVTWAKARGSAGNTVMIKRDNGQVSVFYHLSHIAVKEGDKVAAGQVIGTSGATGMGPTGVVHLHFVYGVPNPNDARAKTFSAEAAKNPTFNPAQLSSALNKKADFNYPTDPSPYFCDTYAIKPDGLEPILGGDTKAQYAKLFGSTPAMGIPPSPQFDATAVAAANGDALQAAVKGATGNISSVLNDADGYGALPSPPIGDYETMSPIEMMATEARRRFNDSEWNQNISKVSSRALWIDYLRAKGVAVYLDAAVQRKRARVEALLAVYTSQQLEARRQRTLAARDRTLKDDVKASIK